MADTTTDKSTAVQPPPPPPRLAGVPEQDLLTIAAHLSEIYQNQFVNFQVTKIITGYDPSKFDVTKLPDPALTTLGQAQKTANEAYALASAAKASVDPVAAKIDAMRYWCHGEITISGAVNSIDYAFGTSEAQPDANYNIVFSSDRFTGTPPFESTQVIKCVRAADKFTVSVNAPPGVGNSVTLQWQLRR
jgi:hypothetical protein